MNPAMARNNYNNTCLTPSTLRLITDDRSIKVICSAKIVLDLPYLWLRDNCSCGQCRVTAFQEKEFIVCDVESDIKPRHTELNKDNLTIVWPDNHITNYQLNEIFDLSESRHPEPKNWTERFKPEIFDWSSFLSDEICAKNAFRSFLELGAITIINAPKESNSLELIAPRLGPIREVLFDRIHNVSVKTHAYNIAHTSLAVPPHNDFASYTTPPTVQALHMLENQVEGGNSIIVDAWKLVEELKQDRPDYFALLCRFNVPFREFDDQNETYACEPIIRFDSRGKISSVRFSNQLVQTVNPKQRNVAEFYLAYHDLYRRITDPINHCKCRLHAGEILLLSAHRVLHGREAFFPNAVRHLQDAYFELDNIINKYFIMTEKIGRYLIKRLRSHPWTTLVGRITI